ncbi:hypothetical protein OR1_01833 [Geobacter sp. OR-1]|nr:hypothetical protein [Geobacter sp. OR-1]GAM09553.1 hypothetical protein OR1_01833 [Geobacter sp. OR-1]
MNTETIDEAIGKYVNERMKKGKKTASERFLTYAYLKHGGDELAEFMKKVVGLSRYYINFLNIMENPFRGPEVAWFGSMVIVAVFGGYLASQEESRMLGILIVSGTLANAWSLLCAVAKKWLDVGVMIAIYREILELAEKEFNSAT